jgi:hypothetical protein
MTRQVRRPRPDQEARPAENSPATSSAVNSTDIAAAAWWKEAQAVIGILGGTGVEFDADDLITLVGNPPRGRQLSTAFAVMRRRHKIVPVRAVIRGSRLLRIWRGAK